MAKAHPDARGEGGAPRVLPIARPTHDLPMENRVWTCPVCGKGLPTLHRGQYHESLARHAREEHELRPRDLYNIRRRSVAGDPILARGLARKVATQTFKTDET